MKIDKLYLLVIVAGLLLLSCRTDEPRPSNFLRINLDGSKYTFIGRSIYEPREFFLEQDTVKNVTYLGGNIGNCFDGNTAFVDVRIPANGTGTFSLEDGISFLAYGENFLFMANERDVETHELTIEIEEYGAMDGRVAGRFSGRRLSESSSVISGTFSMKRLPDHSYTIEVIEELCRELIDD